MISKDERWQSSVALFLALVCYGLVISPLLHTGLLGDDRFDSIWAQVRAQSGVSALADGIEWTNRYRIELGRFHPIAHISNAYFMEVTNLATYKFLQFVLTMCAVLVWALFVNQWAKSRYVSALFVLILASISRFQVEYDPIISFGLHTKLLLIVLGLLFLVVARCVNSSEINPLAKFSIVALAIAVALYYEMGVVALLGLVPLTLHAKREIRDFVIPTSAWVFVAYCSFRMKFYLTTTLNPDLEYYHLGGSLIGYAVTYLKQLSSAIPFAPVIFGDVSWSLRPLIGVAILVSVTLSVSLIHRGGDFRVNTPGESSSWWQSRECALLGAGIILFALPPVVTALSSGHQIRAVWWDGYLNVWFSQVGMSLAFVAIIVRPFSDHPARRSFRMTGLLIFLALGSMLVAGANQTIAEKNPLAINDNSVNGWERAQFQRAASSGALDSAFIGSRLHAFPPRPFFNTEYLATLSKNSTPQIANSWERFGPTPDLIPAGCLAELVLTRHSYGCSWFTPPVVSILATSFEDGLIVVGRASRITLPDDQSVAAYDQALESNAELRSALVFATGRYANCDYLKIVTPDGRPQVVKATWQEIGSGRVLRVETPFLLNSLNGESC